MRLIFVRVVYQWFELFNIVACYSVNAPIEQLVSGVTSIYVVLARCCDLEITLRPVIAMVRKGCGHEWNEIQSDPGTLLVELPNFVRFALNFAWEVDFTCHKWRQNTYVVTPKSLHFDLVFLLEEISPSEFDLGIIAPLCHLSLVCFEVNTELMPGNCIVWTIIMRFFGLIAYRFHHVCKV